MTIHRPGCLGIMLVLLVLSTTVAHADGFTDKLSATVIGATNSGPVFGAALSYQWQEHGWLDAGAKRCDLGTDAFAGLSTDLQSLASFAGRFFDADLGTIPEAARAGGGYQFRQAAWFAYLAYGIGF